MTLNWYHDWGIPNSKDHALDLKKQYKISIHDLAKSGKITPKVGTDNVTPSFWCVFDFMSIHMLYYTTSTLRLVILSDLWYVYLYFAPSRTLKSTGYKSLMSRPRRKPLPILNPYSRFWLERTSPTKCQLLVESRVSDVNICDKLSPDILQLFPTLTVVLGSGGHHLCECWLLIGSRPSPTFFKTFSNIFTTSTLSTPKCSFSSRHEHSISPTILLKG